MLRTEWTWFGTWAGLYYYRCKEKRGMYLGAVAEKAEI